MASCGTILKRPKYFKSIYCLDIRKMLVSSPFWPIMHVSKWFITHQYKSSYYSFEPCILFCTLIFSSIKGPYMYHTWTSSVEQLQGVGCHGQQKCLHQPSQIQSHLAAHRIFLLHPVRNRGLEFTLCM